MAKNKNEALEVMTPKFRVSFPEVFEAKAFEDQAAKFSIQMLFDKKEDLSKLKNAVKAAVKDKWGDTAPKGIVLPFKDGDEKDLEGYEGKIVVGASSKFKPQVLDQKAQEILAQNDFYAGCFARALISAYAWEYKKGNSVLKRGVSFNLIAVQKLADGESFIKRRDASKVFGEVEDGSDDASNYSESDDLDFLD